MYRILISKPNGQRHSEIAKDERDIDRCIQRMHTIHGDVFGIDITSLEDEEIQTKTHIEKIENFEEIEFPPDLYAYAKIYNHFTSNYLMYLVFVIGCCTGYFIRFFVE